ncbi:hypothetical protein BRAS3843_1310007 [Bradyrhizobium sp. STM 3843]|nr:hypothetical protein BRAS3843_1310007 [Bradyrhizobium sp. STM 3843]
MSSHSNVDSDHIFHRVMLSAFILRTSAADRECTAMDEQGTAPIPSRRKALTLAGFAGGIALGAAGGVALAQASHSPAPTIVEAPKRFAGKVVLITGATSGIGRAAAIALRAKAPRSPSAVVARRWGARSKPRSGRRAGARTTSAPTCARRSRSPTSSVRPSIPSKAWTSRSTMPASRSRSRCTSLLRRSGTTSLRPTCAACSSR